MIPHLQSTSYTTAASSLLTILHHLKNTPLTKDKESDIWHKTVNLPTRASSIYALALYAKKEGLNPKLIVEKKEYDFPDYRFYRYKKEDIIEASFSSQLYLEKIEQQQIPLSMEKITLQKIKTLLQENNILLLRLNTKPFRQEARNTSNYVVVFAYTNNHFQIIDPVTGAVSLPENIFQEAFQSLESKKQRAHCLISFSR